MFLIFLISLSLLLYAILGEIESSRAAVTVAARGECPACAQEVETDWLLCPRCRSRLQVACPSCGDMNFAGWHFCQNCGTERTRKNDAG